MNNLTPAINVLTDSLAEIYGDLTSLVQSDRWQPIIEQSFGGELLIETAQRIQQAWTVGDFSDLKISIAGADSLGGAKGAYVSGNRSVYISADFLQRNNPAAVKSVLLEEIGHYLDDRLNNGKDTPGDEGELFAKLEQGQVLDAAELAQLRSKDDIGTVSVDGQLMAAEFAPGDYVNGNLKDLKDGIDGFFLKIKTQLKKLVEDELSDNSKISKIPIVGAKITDLSTSISGRALDFLSSVQTKIDEKFTQAAGSSQLIKTGLAEAFGKSGLDLLKDLTGDGVADEKDITLTESATNLQVNLSLEAKPSALNSITSDNFSLGTSWLGVKGAATIDTKFDATLNLGFGFDNTNGFYVDTSGTKDKSEFIVNLGAAIPNLNLEGNLGPFQAKISNQTTPAGVALAAGFIKTGLAIDLKAKAAPLTADRIYTKEFTDLTIKDNLKADLSGSAALNLRAESKTIDALPSITAEMDIQWDDFIKKPSPTGKFKNVVLDSGTFVKAFNPIFKTLKDINDPVRPVVDLLKTKLPLLNKNIAELSDGQDIISLPGQKATNQSFLTQFVNTSDLIERSTGFGGKITLIGEEGVAIAASAFAPKPLVPVSIDPLAADVAIFPSAAPAIPPEGQKVLDQLGLLQDVQDIANKLKDPANADFQIPLFTDPFVTIPKLLTGETTDLITLKLPTFQTGFKVDAFINVLGPIGVTIDGSLGAALNLKFGYDSKGWNDFSKDNYRDGSKLASGLYIESFRPDVDKYNVFPKGVNQTPPDDKKFDKFIVGVGGRIYGGIGVGFAAGSVTVGGGINASLKLVPANPNGLIRIDDLANPGCVLLPHGKVDAYLGGKIKLGFGPFSISKTLVLARANLLDYTAECASGSRTDRGQAKKAVDGNLELQTTNDNDVFTVRHVPATAPGTVSIAGNEILEVDNSATLPIYTGIKSITNRNQTDGDDIIILDPGVLTAAVLRGGKGFDQLDGGAGNDQLYGDDGEDVLSGNAGNDSLYGGAGDDALTGGAGNDLLDGGTGQNFATYAADPNRIVANSTGGATATVKDGFGGTDSLINIQQLEGSNFGDYILLGGSNQNLVVFGLDGNDRIYTGSGNDFLLGGEGADTLNGGDGEDATSYADSWDSVNINLATTYGDGGTASGDRLFNMEDVQGSIFDDILVGNSSANRLDGGLGADTIEGGAGADTLTAGENGNGGTSRTDLVTYKHSSNRVNVNITAGASNTGGDAEGDVLFAAAYSYTDQQGKSKMTIADVFYNLEGSKFGDILTGNELSNTIYGLAGSDTINSGDGDDTLVGGAGADRFDGGTGSDWADYSISESGSVTFIADVDNNVFPTTGVTVDLTGTGQGGDAQGDTFVTVTDNGNQVATVENIRGTDFGDKLYGDAGNNIIAPGLGIDFVDGRGSDRDILQVDYGIRDIGTGINALGNAPDPNTPGSVITRWDNNGNILDQVTYQNIESLQLTGTIQNDKVGGTSGDDKIDVQDGNDLVYGYSGSDNITGGDGNDSIFGGAGNDSIFGGEGKDILDGGTGNDYLSAGDGDDIVFGSYVTGNGRSAFGGNDSLYGAAGNDLLVGGDGQDLIDGGDGRDLLLGGSGNDQLSGGAGDDVLVGGDSLAARTLYFGPQQNQQAFLAVSVFNPTNLAYVDDYAGLDTLTGGTGADQFWLDFQESGDGIDRDYTIITDYKPTEGDKIVVPVLDRTTIGDGVNYVPDSKLGLTQYGGADSPFFLKQVGADVQIFVATLKPPVDPIIINSVSLLDSSGNDPNAAIVPLAAVVSPVVTPTPIDLIPIDPIIIFQPKTNAATNQIALVQNTTLDRIVLTLPSQLAPPATPASINPLAATVAISANIPLSTSTVESIATLDNSTVPLVTAVPAFTVTQTSDATALLNKFLSPDALAVLKNVKVKVIGDSRAFGTFANDPFGLNDGLVLSTGLVKDLPGVNQKSGRYQDLINSLPEEYTDLNTYLGKASSTPDKIALEIEFDSTETDKNLFFQYVYGSEELTEYGGTQFYDPFSLKLNGQSLAKLSDGKGVNVNNLANRADGPFHPDLIVNSAGTGPAKDITKLDGYTKPETFVGNIRNGRNKLVIKLQDVGDGLLDSAVFLKANSLSTILPTADLPIGGADAVIVTPAQIEVTEGDSITNSFDIKLKGPISAPVTITVNPNAQVLIGNSFNPLTGDTIAPTASTPITLTFTPSNYATPQSIFVKAVDDAVSQGTRTVPITLTTSSADTRFDKLVITPEQVVINDNEPFVPPTNTAKIQGSVWNDLNGNSSRESLEPGLASWQVYLDLNGNGQLDATDTSTLTASDGTYQFTGLSAGTYTVNEVLKPNWRQTFPLISPLSTTAADIPLFTPNIAIEGTATTTGTTNPAQLVQIDKLAQDARFANIKGQGLTTVVIDTGIDVNHPLFGADKNGDGIADRIVYQYDFADNDTDASDKTGHGSHVSSIISSIAPESNIIALKVFKDDGTGSFANLETALQWVANNAKAYNVGAVNISLGDGGNWNTAESRYGLGDELAALASQNIITSAATGNSFLQDLSVQGNAYPAADPNVIGVGAVWATSATTPQKFVGGAIDYTAAPDRVASFSQRSGTLDDVFAPGIFINGANATGGTNLLGGTSQSTAFVSGIATLAQQIAQEKLGRKLTLPEFRSLLATTSTKVKDGDDENTNVNATNLTFPRINALALAEGVLKLSLAAPAANPTPAIDNNNLTPPANPTPAIDNNNLIPPALTTYAIGQKISIAAGQTVTGVNFGNQIIPTKPNDFYGDGKSDILWRHDYGGICLWQMDGSTTTSRSLTSTPILANSWKVAGTGDFSGDGKSDVLWRNDDGTVAVWTMDGPTVVSSNKTSTPTLDNSWKTAGIGDFNGDGKSDILWRNANGAVVVWTMDGSTIVSSDKTSTPSLDSSWKTAGIGDFNGDGKSDILWRNDDGSVALWQMNGASAASSLTSTPSLDSSWKTAGIGDFNGDGKSDILWRNSNTGAIDIWQMNGKNVVDSSLTSTPILDASWTVNGIGDFNGDGKSDILWRKDSVSMIVWQMDGKNVVSSSATTVPADNSSWRVAGIT